MKRLIVSLALLALLLSAPYAMAGGGNGSYELQKAWNGEQTQQKRIASELSRIDRDAARATNGVSVPARQRAVTCPPTPKGQICMCTSGENSKR
jgi:hypothetical protein